MCVPLLWVYSCGHVVFDTAKCSVFLELVKDVIGDIEKEIALTRDHCVDDAMTLEQAGICNACRSNFAERTTTVAEDSPKASSDTDNNETLGGGIGSKTVVPFGFEIDTNHLDHALSGASQISHGKDPKEDKPKRKKRQANYFGKARRSVKGGNKQPANKISAGLQEEPAAAHGAKGKGRVRTSQEDGTEHRHMTRSAAKEKNKEEKVKATSEGKKVTLSSDAINQPSSIPAASSANAQAPPPRNGMLTFKLIRCSPTCSAHLAAVSGPGPDRSPSPSTFTKSKRMEVIESLPGEDIIKNWQKANNFLPASESSSGWNHLGSERIDGGAVTYTRNYFNSAGPSNAASPRGLSVTLKGDEPPNAKTSYAEPSYAQPSYAKSSYGEPFHAKPSCAKPSHAGPSHTEPFSQSENAIKGKTADRPAVEEMPSEDFSRLVEELNAWEVPASWNAELGGEGDW